MKNTFSPEEFSRYSRQIALPEIGLEGQARLKEARVLVIGAGGLGAPVAAYLAASGVGTLGIVDGDAVDLSNLHRQLLYSTPDIGRRKVAVARARLEALNPHVRVRAYDTSLTRDNALGILSQYDLVVDGTDNFRTRYLVNDACVLLGIANVYASVLRFDGQVTVLSTPNGPCYRCLFPLPPPPGSVPSCAVAGVLNVLPGLVGMLQALEALKLILGRGDALIGRLLLVEALSAEFKSVTIRRDPNCIACGTRELRELMDYDEFCSRGQGARSKGQDDGGVIEQISVAELLEWQCSRRFALIDVRERWEWEVGHIAGARWIRLGELAQRVAELDRDTDTIVYCHHGVRGQAAAEQLAALGFRRLFNLAGGIDAWSCEIDASVSRY